MTWPAPRYPDTRDLAIRLGAVVVALASCAALYAYTDRQTALMLSAAITIGNAHNAAGVGRWCIAWWRAHRERAEALRRAMRREGQ